MTAMIPGAAAAAAPATEAVVTGRRRARGRGTVGSDRKSNPLLSFILLILGIIWMVPVFGLLITAFRPRAAATESGWWTAILHPFEESWTLSNFEAVFTQADLGGAFVNSLAVAIPATVLPIMFAAFAAYAFTFLEFPGRDWLFAAVIALLVVPNQVALVPILQGYVNIQDATGVQVIGTYPAVWIVHAAFAMPFAILILRNYMATLPASLIEAARIDGANHFAIFWRLVVPLSMPALASFAIFQFLWVWNDFLNAFIFLGARNPVLQQVLVSLLGRYGEGWQQVAAGSFITLLVPLIVFFSLQRFFVRGLTAGSVK